MRIGYRSSAGALKLALCLGLAGSAALMGGCRNTAAGALLGAFVGGAIGGDAEGAVAGGFLGAGLGAVADSHHHYGGCHDSGHNHRYQY